LDGARRQIGDGEVEGLRVGRRNAVGVGVDEDIVRPGALAQRGEGEGILRAHSVAVLQRDEGRDGIGLGDAHDDRVGAAIAEEVLNRIAHLAVAGEAAEASLEVGEAGDPLGAAVESARHVPDEGGNGGRHAGDRPNTAGQFFDVDTGIGRSDRHSDLLYASQLLGWTNKESNTAIDRSAGRGGSAGKFSVQSDSWLVESRPTAMTW